MQQKNERVQEVLSQINALTESQRAGALRAAEEEAVKQFASPPTFEDFKHGQVSRYPAAVRRTVAVMMIIVLLAAGNVSMFRVFTAGRNHFLVSHTAFANESWQATLVGISLFIMAEIMVVVSVMARAVLFDTDTHSRWRNVMWIPAIMGGVVAVLGNWKMSTSALDTWGIIETFVPPIAVLFMALIGERLVLATVERHHAAKMAFDEAVHRYQKEVSDPQRLPTYAMAKFGSLKDAIRTENLTGPGRTKRKRIMANLTSHEWLILVQRELQMQADLEGMIMNVVNPTMPPTAAKTRGAFLLPPLSNPQQQPANRQDS